MVVRTRLAVVRALVVVVPIAVAASGCGKATPTCDQASGLVQSAHLGQAAAAYALAREHGEGDCADTGLANVKNQYGDAYVDVAKGHVAEDAKDVPGAIAAYRAALAIDGDNPAAKEALARLQQPVPALLPAPAPAPFPTTAAPAEIPAPLIGVIVGALVLLVLVAGLLGWTAWRWRGWSEAQRDEQTGMRGRLEAVRQDATTADKRLSAKMTDIEDGVRKEAAGLAAGLREHDRVLAEMRGSVQILRTSVSGLRTDLGRVPENTSAAVSQRVDQLESHLDDLVDALTRIVADGGRATFQRYARPEG